MKKLTIFKFKSLTYKLLSAIFLSVWLIFSICVYDSFAEVPCKINYQGRLIKDNVPVDGTRTMRFSIHDSAVGPNELWTSGDVNVEVHNGLFRYVIGSDGGDLSSIDWTAGQELYLEVKVGPDILTPREELYAYPYAINSHLLEGATKEYFLNISGETQKKDGGLNIMGNVGIGTTSPIGPLEVKADNQGSLVLRLSNKTNGSSIDFWSYGIQSVGENLYLRGGSGKGLSLGVDGIDNKLYINTSGNVGIGTTSPSSSKGSGGYLDAKDVYLRDSGRWASEGGVFGNWETRSFNTIYYADTDGFVASTAANNSGNCIIQLFVGSTDDPNISIVRDQTNPDGGFVAPVKKGSYWKVYRQGGGGAVRWMPLGG